MSASETPFDVVAVPALRECNGARVAILAHALGSPEEPAGVRVLLDGRPTGVESYTTRWSPELQLVETLAVSDASQLVAKAIGDAVVISAVARPFYDSRLNLIEDGGPLGDIDLREDRSNPVS